MNSGVFLEGKLRLMNNNNTVVLSFYCNRLKHLLNGATSALAIFNETGSEARIKLSDAPTKLYSDGRYAICLAVTKYAPSGVVTPKNRYKKVKVILNPSDFELTEEDFVEDNDGRQLYKQLKKNGFKLVPFISTCSNKRGDLTVQKKKRLYSFHITRYNPKTNTHDKKLKLRHYILGRIAFQCYQAKSKEDATCIAVMNWGLYSSKVITTEAVSFLKSNCIHLILTDFKENWECIVTKQVLDLIRIESC